MKPYSEDLRRRIVAAVAGGMPKSKAARLFDLSLSSVKRYSVGSLPNRSLSLPARRAAGDPREG